MKIENVGLTENVLKKRKLIRKTRIEEELSPFCRSEQGICYDDYACLIAGTKNFPEDMVEGLRYWICNYLSNLGKWLGQDESEEELLEMLIRNRRNSFSVWNDPSMKQRGIAVYVTPSFLNHACDPNLWLRRDTSSKLEFVTSHAINKGDEITIPYVDTTDDLSVRRQKLLTNYLFLCNCFKCQTEEEEKRVREREIEEKTIEELTIPVDVFDEQGQQGQQQFEQKQLQQEDEQPPPSQQ